MERDCHGHSACGAGEKNCGPVQFRAGVAGPQKSGGFVDSGLGLWVTGVR
jgi:hypothetical protein